MHLGSSEHQPSPVLALRNAALWCFLFKISAKKRGKKLRIKANWQWLERVLGCTGSVNRWLCAHCICGGFFKQIRVKPKRSEDQILPDKFWKQLSNPGFYLGLRLPISSVLPSTGRNRRCQCMGTLPYYFRYPQNMDWQRKAHPPEDESTIPIYIL